MKIKIIPGDILVVDRGFYRHYGIYAGKKRVIHFVAEKGDFGKGICIRETGIALFAKGKPVCVCAMLDGPGFSNRKTLRRAKSRIGDTGYDFFRNNCEHFVTWCKTGVSESGQIEKVMEIIAGIPLVGKEMRGILENDVDENLNKIADGICNGIEIATDAICAPFEWMTEKLMSL